ncbi:MAG: MGMT family protein [Candidatus Omnitrophota bacterium]|jgi:methylated-DNA-[protein]-cysteine S-methyltransferase
MKMTTFTKKVYRVVAKIPLGEVRSYKWVAQKAGFPAAYRAVGRALKKNPYPLIIPCHRVVKNDLSLGGYAGGRKNKKMLIKLEKEIAKCLADRK